MLNPRNPFKDGRKEPTTQSYPWTSTYVLCYIYMGIHTNIPCTQTHTLILFIFFFIKRKCGLKLGVVIQTYNPSIWEAEQWTNPRATKQDAVLNPLPTNQNAWLHFNFMLARVLTSGLLQGYRQEKKNVCYLEKNQLNLFRVCGL